MTVWFTSDPHFGHTRIAEIRGFASVEEHDRTIMDNVHAQVKRDDVVWWLGDMSAHQPEMGLEKVDELDCRNRLILGNHDKPHPKFRDAPRFMRQFTDVFEFVAASARIKILGHSVLLSHYPYTGDHTDEDRDVQWRLRDEGEFLLHGHTHSDQVTSNHPRQIHVGMDAWDFKLIPLETITEIVLSLLKEEE